MEYKSKLQSPELDRLYEAILKLKNVEECYRFFEDLCTVSEITAMCQRYEIAEELDKGTTFAKIVEKVGVSSTTVTRVNRCLNYGADGYRIILDRTKKEDRKK